MNNETLTKSFIAEMITKPFNFRCLNIHNWQQSKTVWKELSGFLILTGLLGPLDWVKDRDLQKQGVDFIYKGKYHDLKALVGDYTTEDGLNVVIELAQYGKPSLTLDKLTDALVYTVLEERGVHVVFVDYKKLVKNQDYLREHYNIRTSNNGTGEYVRVPVKDLSKITNVVVKEVKR